MYLEVVDSVDKVKPENVGEAPVWMSCGAVIVTEPVEELTVTLLVVPDILVTPEFVKFNVPPNPTGLPETVNPVLPLTVIVEFALLKEEEA